MTSYKTVKKLAATNAAYIAGLIDGEGTITLTRKYRGEQRQLAVTISSTERELLDFVLRSAGVGKITNKSTTKTAHTPSFTYALHNRQALGLIEQIAPYLKSYKARRAQLVLEKYLSVTPRNGKYSDELLAAKRMFEDEFFVIKPARDWLAAHTNNNAWHADCSPSTEQD